MVKVQQIGYDFFKEDDDIDNEFNKTLENILKKYQATTQEIWAPQKSTQQFNNKEQSKNQQRPQMMMMQEKQKQTVVAEKKEITRAQDDIVLIGQYKGEKVETQLVENRLIRNLEKRLLSKKGRKKNKFEDQEDCENYPDLQYSQIKLMYQSYDSGKLTSTLINLDIEEMSNCLSWAILKHIEFNKKKLQSMLNNSSVPFSIGNKFRNTQNLTQNNDASQNPVEEPTYLNYNDDNQKELFQSQQMAGGQKQLAGNKLSLGVISEKAIEDIATANTLQVKKPQVQEYYEDWEQSRQQIETILKESLLLKNKPLQEAEEEEYDEFNDQLYDEVNSDEESEQDQELSQSEEQSPIKRKYVEGSFQGMRLNQMNQMESMCQEIHNNNYDYTHSQQGAIEVSFVSRFDMVEVENENEELARQKIFHETYSDDNKELSKVIPSQEVISNYCKNIIITSKMEKEVTIVCLIYIERLLVKSGFGLDQSNWRKLLFTSLILASKIWDDESFENDNFAKAFPQYTTYEINELERVFLSLIDYSLFVNSADYAKYYFLLRTFAEAKKKSFPLRPLDLNTIMSLQRTASRAERNLREMYSNPLNKSF